MSFIPKDPRRNVLTQPYQPDTLLPMNPDTSVKLLLDLFTHTLNRVESLNQDLARKTDTAVLAYPNQYMTYAQVQRIRDIVRNSVPDMKIAAIKQIRIEFNLGLKEAKDWCELFF